jgi:hypothetical protein
VLPDQAPLPHALVEPRAKQIPMLATLNPAVSSLTEAELLHVFVGAVDHF